MRLGLGRTGALALAAALFAADQATKLAILAAAGAGRLPADPLPFLEITLVCNRGISYGLFQQGDTGRWVLVALTAAASAGLLVWLWRAARPLLRLALALVLSGAAGNLVDRIVYGAVVDFVHIHVGTFSWYVFNVADAAITVGVVLLLAESFLGSRAAPARTRP